MPIQPGDTGSKFNSVRAQFDLDAKWAILIVDYQGKTLLVEEVPIPVAIMLVQPPWYGGEFELYWNKQQTANDGSLTGTFSVAIVG